MAKGNRSRRAVLHPVRRFEMPYSSASAQLANPELGLTTLTLRAGAGGSYTMNVNVLDASDDRLLRAGIVLAIRNTDGRNEVYLAAPDWAPQLPVEKVAPLAGAETPPELEAVIRPFRRGAAIGPTATLTCHRTEYELRNPQQQPIAWVRSDAVHVRRGGMTTNRYREVTLTSSVALSYEALTWLTEQLLAVGGARVPSFPTLAQRLGPPAIGATDLPKPPSWDPDSPLETYVSALLAARLRKLTLADLSYRIGEDGPEGILRQLAALRSELRGMSGYLDANWVSSLIPGLRWLTDVPVADAVRQLDSDAYWHLLDDLVTATRAPRLGSHSLDPTGRGMRTLAKMALKELKDSAGRLTHTSSDADWRTARDRSAHLVDVCSILPQTKAGQRLSKRAERVYAALGECLLVEREAALAAISGLSPEDAFAAGRDYEQQLVGQLEARTEFLANWPEWVKELDWGD